MAVSALSASILARDPRSIREHARRVGMPGDQIFPVVTTIIVRDDPKEAEAAA